MKPLVLLLSVFVLSLVLTKVLRGHPEWARSGRIAMCAMLLFTAVGHFLFTEGMTMMLPEPVPFKKEIVYLTGFIEILAAAGLLIPSLQKITAWLLIIFFILILPANIHAAINHVDYQRATPDGNGVTYLWFRVPLQILFMGWVYLSAIRHWRQP